MAEQIAYYLMGILKISGSPMFVPDKQKRPFSLRRSFNSFSKRAYYLAASKDALRNAFIDFSISKEALRARVPAALLPFSI